MEKDNILTELDDLNETHIALVNRLLEGSPSEAVLRLELKVMLNHIRYLQSMYSLIIKELTGD